MRMILVSKVKEEKGMNYEIRTPGLIRTPPEICEIDPKARVLAQRPNSRGKEICRHLRAMRIALAKANGIAFYSLECTNPNPCAGTCPVCDDEIRFINEELNKIPPEQRVYPDQFMKSGNGGFR